MNPQRNDQVATKKGSTGVASLKKYWVISPYPRAEYQKKIAAVAAISPHRHYCSGQPGDRDCKVKVSPLNDHSCKGGHGRLKVVFCMLPGSTSH